MSVNFVNILAKINQKKLQTKRSPSAPASGDGENLYFLCQKLDYSDCCGYKTNRDEKEEAADKYKAYYEYRDSQNQKYGGNYFCQSPCYSEGKAYCLNK